MTFPLKKVLNARDILELPNSVVVAKITEIGQNLPEEYNLDETFEYESVLEQLFTDKARPLTVMETNNYYSFVSDIENDLEDDDFDSGKEAVLWSLKRLKGEQEDFLRSLRYGEVTVTKANSKVVEQILKRVEKFGQGEDDDDYNQWDEMLRETLDAMQQNIGKKIRLKNETPEVAQLLLGDSFDEDNWELSSDEDTDTDVETEAPVTKSSKQQTEKKQTKKYPLVKALREFEIDELNFRLIKVLLKEMAGVPPANVLAMMFSKAAMPLTTTEVDVYLEKLGRMRNKGEEEKGYNKLTAALKKMKELFAAQLEAARDGLVAGDVPLFQAKMDRVRQFSTQKSTEEKALDKILKQNRTVGDDVKVVEGIRAVIVDDAKVRQNVRFPLTRLLHFGEIKDMLVDDAERLIESVDVGDPLRAMFTTETNPITLSEINLYTATLKSKLPKNQVNTKKAQALFDALKTRKNRIRSDYVVRKNQSNLHEYRHLMNGHARLLKLGLEESTEAADLKNWSDEMQERIRRKTVTAESTDSDDSDSDEKHVSLFPLTVPMQHDDFVARLKLTDFEDLLRKSGTKPVLALMFDASAIPISREELDMYAAIVNNFLNGYTSDIYARNDDLAKLQKDIRTAFNARKQDIEKAIERANSSESSENAAFLNAITKRNNLLKLTSSSRTPTVETLFPLQAPMTESEFNRRISANEWKHLEQMSRNKDKSVLTTMFAPGAIPITPQEARMYQRLVNESKSVDLTKIKSALAVLVKAMDEAVMRLETAPSSEDGLGSVRGMIARNEFVGIDKAHGANDLVDIRNRIAYDLKRRTAAVDTKRLGKATQVVTTIDTSKPIIPSNHLRNFIHTFAYFGSDKKKFPVSPDLVTNINVRLHEWIRDVMGYLTITAQQNATRPQHDLNCTSTKISWRAIDDALQLTNPNMDVDDSFEELSMLRQQGVKLPEPTKKRLVEAMLYYARPLSTISEDAYKRMSGALLVRMVFIVEQLWKLTNEKRGVKMTVCSEDSVAGQVPRNTLRRKFFAGGAETMDALDDDQNDIVYSDLSDTAEEEEEEDEDVDQDF